jgi:hypothetical protein
MQQKALGVAVLLSMANMHLENVALAAAVTAVTAVTAANKLAILFS